MAVVTRTVTQTAVVTVLGVATASVTVTTTITRPGAATAAEVVVEVGMGAVVDVGSVVRKAILHENAHKVRQGCCRFLFQLAKFAQSLFPVADPGGSFVGLDYLEVCSEIVKSN